MNKTKIAVFVPVKEKQLNRKGLIQVIMSVIGEEEWNRRLDKAYTKTMLMKNH